MITYQSDQVRIIAGDERDRLATIEWTTGKVRVVHLEHLRGTVGGQMEVLVVWKAACNLAAKTEAQ
jgi:hypothetical protein